MAALPNAPGLRVVGRDDTVASQQAMDAARAQPYPKPEDAPPVGLAGYILDQYSLMRRHRDTAGRGWSDRLLAALRAFNGVYDSNVLEEIKKFGGATVYARIIAMKCRGTSSLLRDVYLGTDRPWGIEPSPDPEVPPEITAAIAEHITQTVTQGITAHFEAQKANAAHMAGVAAAHAMGQASGVHQAFIDASIPSHASGPSQGSMAGAIPPGAAAPLAASGAGLPPPPPPPPLPTADSIRDVYDAMMADARDQAKRRAADQAKVAEDKLQERLALGGFYTALAEFLVDLPLFPYACMKGPTVRIKTQVKWTKDQTPWQTTPAPAIPNTSDGSSGMNAVTPGPGMPPNPGAPMTPGPMGQTMGGASPFTPQGNTPPKKAQMARPVVQDIPVLCWERVSPFDVYWTPGVADIEDANVIQRSRLTRAELNDLLDLPGFITEEVRAVLDEYGRGGLVDNWDQTDSERAILESREDPRFNQSGLIACIEFQGNAQGRYLLDMGMDPALIPDPLRDYFCNAWLIGRHIIKVQLSPSPRKRHGYYITSFEKVPGNPCGNGLPDLLADIASVANATLRALVNNLSIASGPQAVINDDRLSDGENGEQMYPWKRWHVKSDPFGNNTEKAVEFFQPQSISQELLGVYTAFSGMADEHSAIPKFMTGSPPTGGLGRTASGLSMLMQNSSKILQTVASNVDRDVINPVLNSLMDMEMLTDQTGLLSGQEKIRVKGVAVAQQRETQRARQLEFLQITANPIDMSIIGPKGRATVLRSVATEIGIPGENIVPSEEQMEEKDKQAQAMAATAAMQGGAPGAPPGAPPSAGGGGQAGPPGMPAGQPPGTIPAAGPPHMPTPSNPTPAGPRTNLVNQGGPNV